MNKSRISQRPDSRLNQMSAANFTPWGRTDEREWRARVPICHPKMVTILRPAVVSLKRRYELLQGMARSDDNHC
jgi:hypothetical protein